MMMKWLKGTWRMMKKPRGVRAVMVLLLEYENLQSYSSVNHLCLSTVLYICLSNHI